MRLKTLIKYRFMTMKHAIFIFYSIYLIGQLLGGAISTSSGGVVGVSSKVADGSMRVWSISMIAFFVFISITALILSQKETRFLITRSVSRKEIFVSYIMLLIPLSAILSAFQIISIYLDSSIRHLFGHPFRGVELDIQIIQAPNMENIVVFFFVSFSMILSFGAICYLVGSLFARWKMVTLCTIGLLFVCFISLLAIPDFSRGVVDVFKYMYTDKNSGLVIVPKQTLLAIASLILAYPAVRGISAVKKS